MTQANTICLWYDGDAEEEARFYAESSPDSSVDAVHKAPGDFPGGKGGQVLTVEFTVMGIPCLGLNGSSVFKHSEAFSFQNATQDQEDTDRYWNAIVGNGGEESAGVEWIMDSGKRRTGTSDGRRGEWSGNPSKIAKICGNMVDYEYDG